MSNPVQRLEALLERVQHNRAAAPRASHPASVAKVQPRAEAAEAVPARPAPVPPPAVTPPRAKPAPTPLEMALEGRVSQPGPTPPAPARKPEPVPAPPAFISPPPRVEPAPPPAAVRAEGHVLADPGVPEPTKPIIQVVSKQPPATVPSFGDLLKRSLSLRPR